MWGEIQLHPYVGGALGGASRGTLRSKAPPTQGGGGFGGRRWRTPYLPKIHAYPPKPPHYFWDETMKKKRGGREREGEEEEES